MRLNLKYENAVVETRTDKGWSVSVIRDGESVFYAVFYQEKLARRFADAERVKLGLKRVHDRFPLSVSGSCSATEASCMEPLNSRPVCAGNEASIMDNHRDNDPNINPIWDRILGTKTDTGTLRLLSLIIAFVMIGGTAFYLLN